MRPLGKVLHSVFGCFNPRICKRCDFEYRNGTVIKTVSIHASVKDATQAFHQLVHHSVVSIHASVKDATEGLPYNKESA